MVEPQSVARKDAIKEGEHLIPEDRLRSSSVSSGSVESRSSDFSFEDSYQLDINEHGSFALDHKQCEPISDPINNDTTTPRHTSTFKTPPVQVMERPHDASAYRIPSYVFAAGNKSSNPNQEWSIASNDSLFSIHTGNTSFTKDQFNWLLKSGELGTNVPSDIRKSGELPPPSPKFVPKLGDQKLVNLHKSVEKIDASKSKEQIIANHFKASSIPSEIKPSSDVGVISPPKDNEGIVNSDLIVNTKQDDINPKMIVSKNERSSMSDEVPRSTSASHHSDASGHSFAFPVLEEIDREKSVNSGHGRVEQQKKSASVDQEGQKTATSPSTAAPSSASWLSCFSCCSCR